MTQQQAYSILPESAKWSCSFGYPGNGGFREYYRTESGERWCISNGDWCGPAEWSCEQVRR